jgi:hypothetical protein
MCPACMTTIALITAGAGSAGGLAAVVVKRLRRSASKETERRDAQEGSARKGERR